MTSTFEDGDLAPTPLARRSLEIMQLTGLLSEYRDAMAPRAPEQRFAPRSLFCSCLAALFREHETEATDDTPDEAAWFLRLGMIRALQSLIGRAYKLGMEHAPPAVGAVAGSWAMPADVGGGVAEVLCAALSQRLQSLQGRVRPVFCSH